MRREQLEHLIRAAGDLLGEPEIIIVGSQAILASFPDATLPGPLTRSGEADLLPIDDPTGEKADRIDACFGEFSQFQETFGIHGDGVSRSTARLPEGWESRLIRYVNENTNGIVGLCLEKHDLCVAKLYAGREKDNVFVRVALCEDLVDAEVILERMTRTELADADQKRMTAIVMGAESRRPLP